MATAKAGLQQTRRELRSELRRKDRERLKALRERVRSLRAERSAALRAIRKQCRDGRERVRQRARERRAALRKELAELARMQRGSCATRVASAARGYEQRIGDARRELQRERVDQRIIARAEGSRRLAEVRALRARHESEESDDAVERNLDADLVPVWRQVRARFKGDGRRSRTEAFLEWAEENPGDVWALRAADADRELAKLLKEQRDLVRKTKGRRKLTRDELERELAAVPF